MIRNTIQNALVKTAVRMLHNHATADEVYAEIRKTHPTISKGTVYRNLQRLAEDGEIRKREFPGHPDRFDDITSDHYHAICCECGNVFDVDMALLSHPENSVHDRHGFRFTGHDLIFHGVCPACQQKEKEST